MDTYLHKTVYQVQDNGGNKVKFFTIKMREINVFWIS